MSTRLELINSMLATTGTARLTAEDDNHPNYITASNILDEVVEEFNSRQLWFNTTIRTLAPNSDGRVVVPSNALSCDPTDGTKSYAIRGQYLFDLGNYTDVIDCSVECRIVMEIDVTDMPPVAIQFIRASSRFQYFLDQDGGGTKLQVYAQVLEAKETQLVTVNMRHQDVNFFGGASYADFSRRRDAYSLPLTRIQ